MTLNNVLFQWGAILFGALFVSCVVLLILRQTRRGSASNVNVIKEEKKHQDVSGAIGEILEALRKDPSSKKSIRIRLSVSFGVVFLAFLLLQNVMFALLLGAGVFFLTGFYFNKQLKAKVELFDNQLVETLGAVTNAVRAGQSLQQALENMAREAKEPIAGSFSDALRKVKLGISLDQALSEMSAKIQSKDLRIVVTAINLARETGGNLGEILTRIASTMRERKKIQGKINALTAQGRMSGMVMGGVPFLLLAVLYFIEPDMMGLLFTTILGNIMLTVSIVMVALGMFVISKIVDIDI